MGDTHAILWNGTTPTDLGTLGGNLSMAAGINDAGQVVGISNSTNDLAWHAVVWNGTSLTDLGTLGTGRYSWATDINNTGQIVGHSYTVGDLDPHAVLWNGTVATDLNQFLDAAMVSAGWVLQEANAINDSGWIAGSAYNSSTGETRAYLLMAIPEPETCALMLAGLGVVGFAARRPRKLGLTGAAA